MDSEHTIDSDIGVTPVDVDATKLAEQDGTLLKVEFYFTGLNKTPRALQWFPW